MSRFRLHLRGTGAAGYDTRFGTATDATTGLNAFALNAGKKRVYVNSLGGFSDANNGLTAATAKATLEAGHGILNGGDQLLLAKGGTYANSSGNVSMVGKGGVSKTYPTLVASYDPADPTNDAKIGKMFGPDVPIVTIPSSATGGGVSFLSFTGDNNTDHNLFVQGIELKYATNDGSCANINYVGRHDGIGFQNCRFNAVTVAHPNNSSSFGLSQGVHVSKCSGWGAWAPSGNSEITYWEGIDGLYFEDCVQGHGGWKVGASRDDLASAGGAGSGGQGHNYYYHATSINGVIRRVVSFDSATDGHNLRGSTAQSNVLVSLDCPIGINQTGTSASYSEAPNGSTDFVTDLLLLGGADINSSQPRGYGVNFANAAATGVGIDNALAIDNPILAGPNNILIRADGQSPSVAASAISLSRFTAYGYASTLTALGGNPITLTWTSAATDTLAPGTGNVISTSAMFPNAKTRDQVVSALLTAASVTPGANYAARKAQLVNLMLYRPDLDWARYLVSIAFPAFNKTQTLAALSPPNLSAVTPATIY